MARTKSTRDHYKTCHPGGYLAMLVVMAILSAGCIMADPQANTGIADPVTIQETLPQVTAPLRPEPVQPVTIREKKIAITRPKTLGVFPAPGTPIAVIDAVNNITDSRTADSINGYLRWESVRARTGTGEASRIKTMIANIDSAIGSSSLDEELILYRGIGGEMSRKITIDSSYAEEGYQVYSFDPSVVYHAMEKTSRDRDGYLTMLVIRQTPGSHVLYVNENERQILLPRAMSANLIGMEKEDTIEFTLESLPRYTDDEMKKVQLMYITQMS